MNKQAIIDVLNEVRQSELTSISQYMAHSYYLNDMGFKKLGAESEKEALDEMKHAEALAVRILDLEGDPEFKPLNPPHKKGTVEEMFKADIALEKNAIERLGKGIKICNDNGDAASRMILDNIIQNEETHLFALKQHLKHLTNLGNDYLLKFVGE